MISLAEAVLTSKKHNACVREIREIEKFKNWEQFLKHEKAILWIYWYAKNIIKDRWSDAEEYIMKDPEWIYYYAKNIIKGRWYEAEEYIKKTQKWAYQYAKNIIKNRWPEAEEYIMKDPELWDEYNKFIKEL